MQRLPPSVVIEIGGLVDDLRAYPVRYLGDPGAALVIDETRDLPELRGHRLPQPRLDSVIHRRAVDRAATSTLSLKPGTDAASGPTACSDTIRHASGLGGVGAVARASASLAWLVGSLCRLYRY